MTKTARKLYADLDEATLDGTELLIVEIAGRKYKRTGFAPCEKHITIEDPESGQKINWFRTNAPITVQKLVGDIDAGTSAVATIKHDTSRSATGTTVDVMTASSTTTGTVISSGFDDATIPADSYVWVELGTVTGAVTQLHLDLFASID